VNSTASLREREIIWSRELTATALTGTHTGVSIPLGQVNYFCISSIQHPAEKWPIQQTNFIVELFCWMLDMQK